MPKLSQLSQRKNGKLDLTSMSQKIDTTILKSILLSIFFSIILQTRFYPGSSPHLPRRGFLPSANPLPPPPPPPSNVAAHHLLPPPPTSMTPAGSTSSPASSSTASQPQPQFQRRIAPDYSVAAQMAAQISHAKHVRQMNNAAAAARRTSFQSQLSSSPSQVGIVIYSVVIQYV